MDIGGSELNALRSAELLDRKRFELLVICLRKSGPLMARYAAAGIPVHSFPISNLYGLRTVRQGYRLARFLRHERIQIVHTHDIYTNIFVTPWARLAGVRVVIASRRWWQSLTRRHHRVANGFAYRMAHCVLANSPAVAASVSAVEGIPSTRVSVISNFVTESAFAAPTAQLIATWRRELDLPDEALIVGSVARLVPVKDHASLLRATALLRPRLPQLRVVLIGDGECRTRLEELAAVLGVSDIVRFAGQRVGAANLHHLFDVSVLCSTSEGFPNSLVEAMAAGKPVVATAVGGSTDAVCDGETGLLVPASDPERLAWAIGQFLLSSDLRRDMGAAGRQRARAHYGAESVMASLESLYERLLDASSATAA
ncbi:MAG: glycosyltransferase [Gemmatimonadaceae bacterium]